MVLSYLGKQNKTTTTTPRPPRRRPNPFSLLSIFGHPPNSLKNIKKNKDKKPTQSIKQIFIPKVTDPAPDAKLQFFGPKDFVPKAPHHLPTLRPMRLKYSSTKDFPSKTYGSRLVPMPR